MRVIPAALVAVLVVVVPTTAQAAPPPPDVPNAIMGGPSRVDLPEMPEGTVNDRSLPEQASAMAEAQARPAMATTARKKRGRAVARVAHAGHACYGATHNPHWSSHYPGYIAVQGETTCWNHSVSVTTHLYKWIFGAWYFRDAASNSGWQTTRVSAKWNGTCGWWLGTSGHSATFHYPAGTSNQAYVSC